MSMLQFIPLKNCDSLKPIFNDIEKSLETKELPAITTNKTTFEGQDRADNIGGFYINDKNVILTELWNVEFSLFHEMQHNTNNELIFVFISKQLPALGSFLKKMKAIIISPKSKDSKGIEIIGSMHGQTKRMLIKADSKQHIDLRLTLEILGAL
jgi:hypothetical protein